jgi:hypothetical protein
MLPKSIVFKGHRSNLSATRSLTGWSSANGASAEQTSTGSFVLSCVVLDTLRRIAPVRAVRGNNDALQAAVFSVAPSRSPSGCFSPLRSMPHTPSYEKSPHLIKELRTVNGLPQGIYRIPLRDLPEVGYFGAIPKLVDRIITGPTQYPRTLLV